MPYIRDLPWPKLDEIVVEYLEQEENKPALDWVLAMGSVGPHRLRTSHIYYITRYVFKDDLVFGNYYTRFRARLESRTRGHLKM